MFNVENLPVRKFVVVGSYALGTRTSADIDIVCSLKDIQLPFEKIIYLDHTASFVHQEKKIECLLIDNQPSLKSLYNSYHTDRKVNYANNAELFAIKKAHIHRANQQWIKHIHDYHVLKNQLDSLDFHTKPCCNGLYTIEEFSSFHKATLDSILKPQHQVPLVGVSKSDFFNDYVEKLVDHDWLHELFAHQDVPVYTRLQDNSDIVYCSETKWFELSYIEKCYCVLEECYVIATERFLIKKYFEGDANLGISLYKQAFIQALSKVCTTLTSGFFREFAIENYFYLVNNYSINYFENIKPQLDLKKSEYNES
jgi:hypothetical protein